MRTSSPTFPDLTVLTDRQRQCLERAVLGQTSREIGKALGISSRTVDEHLATACGTLGVRTRVQAAAVITHALQNPRRPLPARCSDPAVRSGA